MKKNREELIAIMERNNLKSKHVANVLGKSDQTVRIWRSESGRDISDKVLDYLRGLYK